MDDIDLPPLPETTGSLMLYEHAAEQLRSYARAAVLADREARGEPIEGVVLNHEGRPALVQIGKEDWHVAQRRSQRLYASPQPVEQRRPLSDREIIDTALRIILGEPPDTSLDSCCLEVARWVERMHGIGKEAT